MASHDQYTHSYYVIDSLCYSFRRRWVTVALLSLLLVFNGGLVVLLLKNMFSSGFWENDFVSQTGFDTLVTRMKEGRQTCRDIEDFLKQRSKAEEDFAKALLKIARVERAQDESGTMKSAIDVLRQEAEVEASLHSTHSQQLLSESTKLAEFREKQREERRRHEEAMHKAHKAKSDNFRRLQSCKSSYESKFRAAEKADSDAERLKFGAKPKEADKARKNASSSRQVADKADEEYKSAVEQLEITRQSWEQDHRSTSEIFQRLEEERLQYLRNALWIFANLGSDLFVKSDEARENMRLSLDKCSVDDDISDFVSRKSTGTQPLSSIPYAPCGGTSAVQTIVNNAPRNLGVRQDIQDEYSLAGYASVGMINQMQNTYKALYTYVPRGTEEIELEVGDRVIMLESGSDGWMKGKNMRTGEQGLCPANYVAPE